MGTESSHGTKVHLNLLVLYSSLGYRHLGGTACLHLDVPDYVGTGMASPRLGLVVKDEPYSCVCAHL